LLAFFADDGGGAGQKGRIPSAEISAFFRSVVAT